MRSLTIASGMLKTYFLVLVSSVTRKFTKFFSQIHCFTAIELLKEKKEFILLYYIINFIF